MGCPVGSGKFSELRRQDFDAVAGGPPSSPIQTHDTCGLPTTGYRCVVAAGARTLAAQMGKPLWESELGATPATGTPVSGRPS